MGVFIFFNPKQKIHQCLGPQSVSFIYEDFSLICFFIESVIYQRFYCSSKWSSHTYLLIDFLPGLAEASDDGRGESNGDVETAVEVVVSVAVEGNLDEVLYHCGPATG